MEKRKGKAPFLLSALPILRAQFFVSPQPPCDTVGSVSKDDGDGDGDGNDSVKKAMGF